MPIVSLSFMALMIGVFLVYYVFPQRYRWVVLLGASLLGMAMLRRRRA